jgi:hypothetical protein
MNADTPPDTSRGEAIWRACRFGGAAATVFHEAPNAHSLSPDFQIDLFAHGNGARVQTCFFS